MRFSLALLSAALLPLTARAVFHSNDTACTHHYTVQDGDTCDKIGQKTLTSTYQILAFNLLDAGADCYTLEIGSQLCLGRYGNDCQFVHQCTNQDTCESIANAYGITTQLLQSNNPSLDCNVVYDGLMLCVSAGSIRPPADNSINATDAKIAREKARQDWLLQQNANKPKTQTNSKAKAKGTSHHIRPSTKGHSAHQKQPHPHTHTSANLHHTAHESKPHQKPDSDEKVAQPGSKLPSPTAGDAPTQPKEQHHPAHSSTQQHQVGQPASTDGLPSTSSSSSPKKDLHPSLPSDGLKHGLMDELLASTPLGSNHTPHLTDQRSLPPLAGATGSPQARHRSLSSRSHHQRPHTP